MASSMMRKVSMSYYCLSLFLLLDSGFSQQPQQPQQQQIPSLSPTDAMFVSCSDGESRYVISAQLIAAELTYFPITNQFSADLLAMNFGIYNSTDDYNTGPRRNFFDTFVVTSVMDDQPWSTRLYEGCLPNTANACFMAEFDGWADITFKQDDGGAILTGVSTSIHTFSSDEATAISRTYIELGDDCIPVCEANEVLFEHDIYMQGVVAMDWWVEEQASQKKILECEGSHESCNLLQNSSDNAMSTKFLRTRKCLPSFECFRYAIGREAREYVGVSISFVEIQLRYQGELVASRRNVQHQVIDIGGPTCAMSVCNGTSQVSFEISIWRGLQYRYDQQQMELPTLSLYMNDTSRFLIQHTWQDPSTRFNYYQHCLPVQSCMDVSLYVQEEMPNSYGEFGSLHVSFGGTTYYDAFFAFGNTEANPLYEKHLAVGDCTVQDLCKENEESLFDIAISLSAFPSWFGETEAIATEEYYLSWVVEYADNVFYPAKPLYSQEIFDYYSSDSQYRMFLCIPSEGCTQFSIWTDGFVFYDIYVNGDLKVATQDLGDYSREVTTLIDNYCGSAEDSLSNRAMAGILVGSLVVAGVAAFCSYKAYLDRNNSAQPPPIQPQEPIAIRIEEAAIIGKNKPTAEEMEDTEIQDV